VLSQEQELKKIVKKGKGYPAQVLQCKVCRVVLANSSEHMKHFVFTGEGDKNATLFFAVKIDPNTVQVDKHKQFKQSGFDAFCITTTVYCLKCGQSIGKYYHSTNESLGIALNRALISIDFVSAYQIGKGHLSEQELVHTILNQKKRLQSEETVVEEAASSLVDKVIDSTAGLQGADSELTQIERQVFRMKELIHERFR